MTPTEKRILATARKWWRSTPKGWLYDAKFKVVNPDLAMRFEEACAADAAARKKGKRK